MPGPQWGCPPPLHHSSSDFFTDIVPTHIWHFKVLFQCWHHEGIIAIFSYSQDISMASLNTVPTVGHVLTPLAFFTVIILTHLSRFKVHLKCHYHLFNTYLLSAYYVAGSVADIRNIAVNESDITRASRNVHSVRGRTQLFRDLPFQICCPDSGIPQHSLCLYCAALTLGITVSTAISL